jgi:hypothetical protein
MGDLIDNSSMGITICFFFWNMVAMRGEYLWEVQIGISGTSVNQQY